MADINDVFSSSLKATDLGPVGSKVTVQILDVEPVEFKDKNGNTVRKLKISFVGKNKTLTCNVTNARTIAKYHGSDYNGWIGKKIVLEHALVDFGGDEVSGIRVPKPPPVSSLRQQAATMKPAFVESENPADDIADTF